MRNLLGQKGVGDDPDFRWRGGDATRLEGFSDAVFGFSMTLLIVSLEVPKTYDSLIETLLQFPAFGISYLFLFFIWYQHYLFFRRYGLNDLSVVVMNGFLMFLVLFFVFPFRWMVSLLINGLFLGQFLEIDIPIGFDVSTFSLDQYSILHTIYAVGFVALFGCFLWLYAKALKEADRLELDQAELATTWAAYYAYLIVIAVAVVSIILVWLVPQPWNAPVSGWIFALIWPLTLLAKKIKHSNSKVIRNT